MECFNLNNNVEIINKKEQITNNPFKLRNVKDDVLF